MASQTVARPAWSRFDPDPDWPMDTGRPSSSATSVESCLQDLQRMSSEIGEIVEGYSHSNGGSGDAQYRHQLRTLQERLKSAVAAVDLLRSTALRINDLPSEILIHIFAFIRHDSAVRVESPARWPFTMHGPHTFPPILTVCRRWRNIILSTPLLWTHITTPCLNHHALSLSGSCPIVLDISLSVFTPRVDDLLRNVGSRMRELHIDAPIILYHNLGRESAILLSFLQTFDASHLQHCKIYLPVVPSAYRQAAFLPLFCGTGTRLQSLYLDSTPFLPEGNFTSLTRLTLSCSHPFSSARFPPAQWDLDHLVSFLARCPQLRELSLCHMNIARRESLGRAVAKPITLRHLRHIALGHERSTHNALQRLCARLVLPSNCHFALTAAHPLDLAKILSSEPVLKEYTKLRVDLSSARPFLQLLHPATNDAVSVWFPARAVPTQPLPGGGMDTRADLREIFAHLPFSHHIDELWLALAPSDYLPFPGHTNTNTTSLSGPTTSILVPFPRIKRLVVSQPAVLPSPYHAPAQVSQRMLAPLGTLIYPIWDESSCESEGCVARAAGAPCTLACPRLETLCVSVPAYTGTREVGVLREALRERWERGHRVRKLVIGCYPGVLLNVVAQLEALSAYVDEVVCTRDVEGRGGLASDWLSGVPEVFDEGDGLHSGWGEFD